MRIIIQSIQEFMLVPHGFDSFSDALRAGSEVHTVWGVCLTTCPIGISW